MNKRLSWLLHCSAVAALLSGATAPVHGGPEVRGCAILPPYESPDPPGYNSANGDIDRKGGFYPYYSPLVPISVRWGYKHVVPYYSGYRPNGRYGANGCCPPNLGHDYALDHGVVVGPLELPAGARFDYGAFTGDVGKDDNRYWRMGGNGPVPYGTAQPPRSRPDLIDVLGSR